MLVKQEFHSDDIRENDLVELDNASPIAPISAEWNFTFLSIEPVYFILRVVQ